MRERGIPIESNVLEFKSPAEEDDQHRHEQPPPSGPDEPDAPFCPDEYTAMICRPSGHAPRLWLKGKWGEIFPSLPWNPLPAIFADLDRQTRSIPQAIEIHSMRGVARIEGFHLEGLAEKLNAQHVIKIFTYCEKRWPGTRFEPKQAKVIRIKWTWFDEEMEQKAQRARENQRVQLVEPGEEPDR